MTVKKLSDQKKTDEQNTVNQTSGDTFSMSGDFRGTNVNIKSTLNNVTQTVGILPDADGSLKEELGDLIQQLNRALQQVPAEKVEEAEAVAKTAEAFVQTATDRKPNNTLVSITGEGLMQAAKAVADVVPVALKTATRIVEVVSNLRG